jgi:hypothetical protein
MNVFKWRTALFMFAAVAGFNLGYAKTGFACEDPEDPNCTPGGEGEWTLCTELNEKKECITCWRFISCGEKDNCCKL